jgi:hypothetical protein
MNLGTRNPNKKPSQSLLRHIFDAFALQLGVAVIANLGVKRYPQYFTLGGTLWKKRLSN